jgi:hypothetical protein
MTRYTAFCIITDSTDTLTWIDRVEAATEEEAVALAEAACADDWEYDVENVLCIGLAVGDVKIAYWHPEH